MKESSQHFTADERELYGPVTTTETNGALPPGEEEAEWTELSDKELLQLCPGNEHAAWELWCRYRTQLEHVVAALTRLPRWDIEEIMSTAALRFHRQVPRYAAHIRNLQAWMSTLSRNVAMDYLRSAGRFQRQHADLDEDELAELSSWKLPVIDRDRLDSPEIREAVRFGIESLSARLRETAKAHFLEEKSYKEISRMQRIRPATVRKRIQIARTHLRQTVADYLKTKSPSRKEQAERKPITVEAAAKPRFEILCTPISSRFVALPGRDKRLHFHHLFFSHRLGREEQKLKSLQEYAQCHPRGWFKQLELAEVNLSLGQWEEALARFEICRRHEAAGLQVFLRPVRLLQLMGMNSEARHLCVQAMQGERDPGSRFHMQAIMAEVDGEDEQAQAMWQQARAAEPQNPAHAIAAAEWQIALGNSGPATRVLEELLALEPNHLQAQNLMLDLLFDRGDYGAGYEYVKNLYAQGDRNARVIQYSSDFRAKEPLEQEEGWMRLHPILTSMAKETPGLWRLLDAQAALLCAEGKWNLLEKQMISTYADDPDVWATRSAWLAKIRHPQTLTVLRQALTVFPEEPALLEAAAYISMQEQQISLFRDFFDVFSRLQSQSPRLLAAAAMGASGLLDEHEAAAELAFRGAGGRPEDPATWLGLGCILVNRSRFQEAIKILSESWSLATTRPGNVLTPAVALYLGHALSLYGRGEEARKWYTVCSEFAQTLSRTYSHPSLYWRQLTDSHNNATRNIFHDLRQAWKILRQPFHFISYPAWNYFNESRVEAKHTAGGNHDGMELHKITSNPKAQSGE